MSTESVSTPVDTPDWLDGATEIELSSRHLRAYWDADIIDGTRRSGPAGTAGRYVNGCSAS